MTLNAAIILVHDNNCCSEEKHSKKNIYETQLFCNWVEVFLLTLHCDFMPKPVKESQNLSFLFLCPNRWQTMTNPKSRAHNLGCIVVCLHVHYVCVCVCELPPRSLCLLIRWFILICLIADEETKLCQVPQIPWEVPTSFTKLKKSHFLSWKFFIFIKEIIEEVLEIPPYGTEDVSVAKQRM